MQGVGTRATVARIQRCFYMDIQRFGKESTRVGTTHN